MNKEAFNMQRLIWQYICEQWMHYLMTNISSQKMYSNSNQKSLWLPVKKHTIPGYSKHSKIILMHVCTFSPLNSLDLQINFESEQSLQTKQDSLLLRIDDLDQENRELKDQVSEIEEEKDRIEETLEKVQKNVKQYKQKLKDNQVQIDNTCIYNI